MNDRRSISLFLILLYPISILECNDYYGKTVSQLKEVNSSLQKAIDQSSNDLKWYNLFYFKAVKKPNNCYIKKIKRNIAVLKQAIQEIEQCLTEAREELSVINQKKIGITCNDVNDIVANIALAPWLLIEGVQKKRSMMTKENEIKTMLATKQELQTYVDKLSRLLEIY